MTKLRRTVNVSRFLGVLILCSQFTTWVVSCSKSGSKEPAAVIPEPENKTFDQVERALEVELSQFAIAEEPDLECQVVEPKSAIQLENDDVVVDGLFDEWVSVPAFSYLFKNGDPVTSFKTIKSSKGLFFGILGADIGATSIRFLSLTHSNKNLSLGNPFSIEISSGDIWFVDAADRYQVTDSRLASVSQSAEGVELFVSNQFLDRVRLLPGWGFKIESFAAEGLTQSMPHIEPSSHEPNNILGFRKCLYQFENGEFLSLTEITPPTIPMRPVNGSFVDVLSRGEVFLTKEQRNSYDVFLLRGAVAGEGDISMDSFPFLISTRAEFVDRVPWIKDFQEFFKKRLNPTADPLFSEVIGQTVAIGLAREQLGEYYFLNLVRDYLAAASAYDPAILSLLLIHKFGLQVIQSTFLDCESSQGSELLRNCFFRNLIADYTGDLLADWELEKEIVGFNVETFFDRDLDGLYAGFESRIGTSDFEKDSDFDGWTDLSEFIFGQNPLSSISKPRSLAVDGTIGDWLSLIPARVIVDQDDKLSNCKNVDITYYNAILMPGWLILGASLAEDPQAEIRWEIVLESAAGSYIVSVDSSDRGFQLNESSIIETPFATFEHEVEFLLPESLFEGPINIQVKVLMGADLCDDTNVFSPIVKKSG
ncbi:MAG: hypothetical protein HRU19_14590 [Pseudobacteriovorax sp.]|nr:hypothetical protein [Pseudobacteriovorax sp.]